MKALNAMQMGVRAMKDSDLLSAERMFRSVCFDRGAADKVRTDALQLLCHCMDRRGLWHESESEAMRVHRLWDEQRRRERNTMRNVVVGVVGLLAVVAVGRGLRARAA